MPVTSTVKRGRAFAHRYVKNGFRGPQAVIDLGFTSKRESAWVISHRLLRNVKVLAEIDKHIAKAKMSADEVLERLTDIAQSDAKFSGSDVVKATELLGKANKLFTDKIEHSGDISVTKRQEAKQILGISSDEEFDAFIGDNDSDASQITDIPQ